MLGFELTDLELDHDVSELLDVEEHEIGVVVGSVDVEVALSADEGEPASELQQRFLQSIHQGAFDVAFSGSGGQGEEVEEVGVWGQAVGEVRGGRAEPPVEWADDLIQEHLAGPAMLHRSGGITSPARQGRGPCRAGP